MFGRWLRGEGATEQLSGGDAQHTSIARELPGADTERRPSGTFVSSAFDAVARGSTCWRQAFVDELDGPLPSNRRVFWRKTGTSRVHEGVIGVVVMDLGVRW